MIILGLDPGTTQTGWALLEGKCVLESGTNDNNDVIRWVRHGQHADELAIEMIHNMGMPIGRETLETVVWIGRFYEAWGGPTPRLLYRSTIKLHLCGSARAKDPSIRQSLIDRLGPVGTVKSPGPCHGVKTHAWSALAVAFVARDSTHDDSWKAVDYASGELLPKPPAGVLKHTINQRTP